MIEYKLNNKKDRIDTQITGVMTTGEIIAHFNSVSNLSLNERYIEVVDLSGVEDCVLIYSDFEKIGKLSAQWSKNGHLSTLFFTPTKVSEEVGRMMALLMSDLKINIQLCQSQDEIEECLSVIK